MQIKVIGLGNCFHAHGVSSGELLRSEHSSVASCRIPLFHALTIHKHIRNYHNYQPLACLPVLSIYPIPSPRSRPSRMHACMHMHTVVTTCAVNLFTWLEHLWAFEVPTRERTFITHFHYTTNDKGVTFIRDVNFKYFLLPMHDLQRSVRYLVKVREKLVSIWSILLVC